MSILPPDDNRQKLHRIADAAASRLDATMRAAEEAVKRQEEQHQRIARAIEGRSTRLAALDFRVPTFEFPRLCEPRWAEMIERLEAGPNADVVEELRRIRSAIEGARDREASGRDGAGGDKPNLTKEAQALALLVMNEDWSIAQLADALGVHRTTPYTWPKFLKAWHALRGDRSDLPRGEKDEEGNLEAEA